MNAKPWYASKVIWLNVISAIIMILQSSELVTIVPVEWTEELALGLFVLNIGLRFVTTGAVTLTSDEAAKLATKGPHLP